MITIAMNYYRVGGVVKGEQPPATPDYSYTTSPQTAHSLNIIKEF